MPPRTDRDALRTRLVDTAARLIAADGTLTLRRLADEAGTSTMAIYTLFGGMEELRRAVRWEGFARLAAALAEVPESDDPAQRVADLSLAYYANSVAHPDLYRVMFMEGSFDATDREVGQGTFEALIDALARCPLPDGDPHAAATEMWAMGHGIIALQLAGALEPEQGEALFHRALGHLLVAFGCRPG
jgi:AcrR family transcriptional regulator